MDNGTIGLGETPEWIRDVRFVKKLPIKNEKVEKIDQIQGITNELKPQKVQKTSNCQKFKRLTFKVSKRETLSKEGNLGKDKQNSTKVPTISTNSKPVRSKKPRAVHEYGPDVNGYKFIAFSENEIPEPKIEKHEKNDDHENYDRSEANNDEYNYKMYISLWNDIEKGITYETLPLPLFSDNVEDLNEKNIKEFLNTKLRLKIERVRWHPDKMRGLLIGNNLWCPEMESEVTRVFQTINRVYETISKE